MEISTLSNTLSPQGSMGQYQMAGEQQGYLLSHSQETGTTVTLDFHASTSNFQDIVMKRCQLYFYHSAL